MSNDLDLQIIKILLIIIIIIGFIHHFLRDVLNQECTSRTSEYINYFVYKDRIIICIFYESHTCIIAYKKDNFFEIGHSLM